MQSRALRGHAPHRALQSDSRSASLTGSPMGVFATPRINALKRAACCIRSGPVARNGLSLARNSGSVSKPPSRGQSSWPATSLPTARPHCPFGSSAPPPPPVCPGWTAVSLPQSRCSASVRFVRLLLRSPLPSRTVTSLGIKAFNRFGYQTARLPNPPDFLSLPAALIYY
jgi:hypothetical protein